jgi:hypothetical protein
VNLNPNPKTRPISENPSNGGSAQNAGDPRPHHACGVKLKCDRPISLVRSENRERGKMWMMAGLMAVIPPVGAPGTRRLAVATTWHHPSSPSPYGMAIGHVSMWKASIPASVRVQRVNSVTPRVHWPPWASSKYRPSSIYQAFPSPNPKSHCVVVF